MAKASKKQETAAAGKVKAKCKAKAVASLPKQARTTGRVNSQIVESAPERRKSRKLDGEVRRLLKKWYPVLSEAEAHANPVDSHTLYEYVAAQKIEHTKKGTYFSDEFFVKAAAKYRVDMCARPVAVRNAEEVVDHGLVSAISSATTKCMKQRTKESIISYFAQGKVLNQRSLAGLIAQLVKLTPGANADTASIFIEFLRLIVKKKLHLNFAEDFWVAGLFFF